MTISSSPPPPAPESAPQPTRRRTDTLPGWPPPRARLPSIELGDDDVIDSTPPPLPHDEAAAIVDAGLAHLEAAKTDWLVARRASVLLARALRAKAVLVHRVVAGRLELIGGEAPGLIDLLGTKIVVRDDNVASSALAKRKPVKLDVRGEVPRRARKTGATRSFAAFPVMVRGACVGLVEVIDAEERLLARAPTIGQRVFERIGSRLG